MNNDVRQFIDHIVLTDNCNSIAHPVVYTYNQHKILYCTNCNAFADASIDELKTYSLIVVNESIDNNSGNRDFCDFADKHNLNVVLLVGDAWAHQTQSQIIYYPYWYHRCRQEDFFYPGAVYKNNCQSTDKTHKISCLNGNPRWHRIYNYLLLKDKPYFNELLFSMHTPSSIDTAMASCWVPPHEYVISSELLAQWHEIKDNFLSRDHTEKTTLTRIDADLDHPAYTDSHINLVTESSMDAFFVTEKTWKPIASGQLFLIIGGLKTVAWLKDFGVDTFDDIIDHKYYDNEPDWQTRIHKVHAVLEDLLSQNITTLSQATQQRRLHNAEKFFNEDHDRLYQPSFEQCITTLK